MKETVLKGDDDHCDIKVWQHCEGNIVLEPLGPWDENREIWLTQSQADHLRHYLGDCNLIE